MSQKNPKNCKTTYIIPHPSGHKNADILANQSRVVASGATNVRGGVRRYRVIPIVTEQVTTGQQKRTKSKRVTNRGRASQAPGSI